MSSYQGIATATNQSISEMNQNSSVFTWLGVGTLGTSVLWFTGAVLGARHIGPKASVNVAEIAVGLALVAAGVGLIRHHRWAAMVIAVAMTSMSAWLCIGSMLTVPMPWLLMNLAFASALLALVGMIIWNWPQLTRRT